MIFKDISRLIVRIRLYALMILQKIGIYYTNAIVFEKSLLEPLEMGKVEDEAEVRLLNLHNAKRLAKRFRSQRDALKRLYKGDLCFSAEKGEEILSYVWVAFDEAYVGELRRRINIGQSEAYMYDGFTVRNHRKRGLFSKVLAEALKYLAEKGYKNVYVMALADNSSVLGIFKAWNRLGMVKYVGILGWGIITYDRGNPKLKRIFE